MPRESRIGSLSQWYSGTIVRVSGTPFYIEGFEETTHGVQASGSTLVGGLWTPMRVNERDLDTRFPNLGYINVDDFCVYLMRTSTRQYTRGYHHGVISVVSPVFAEIQQLGRDSHLMAMDTSIVGAVFDRQYPSATEALKLVRNAERLAVAFSERYCFCIKSGYQHPMVGYKDKLVGHVQDSGVVALRSRHLLETLSTHIRCEVQDEKGVRTL